MKLKPVVIGDNFLLGFVTGILFSCMVMLFLGLAILHTQQHTIELKQSLPPTTTKQ